MTMLDAALSYAGRGWHILPLKARGKTPLTLHRLERCDERPRHYPRMVEAVAGGECWHCLRAFWAGSDPR